VKNLSVLDQETELRQAIINSEFFLCYQPQFDLSDEKLESLEALIRWKHPTKGVLLPIDFIPLAEEIGVIVQMGEWVIRTACMQIKSWENMGFPPIRVAVNISAQQFKYQNVPAMVKSILDETGLDPKYLEIELTENVILSSREIIVAVTELKKLGVLIAIDDFGTGYSVLSYLHELPLDRLKIDKSFIDHIHAATDDEVIIRAVIAMAKKLNLEVLAEGVETIEQVNFLKNNKCGDVQGFYFSKPLTTDEVESYISEMMQKEKLNITE
jgi:EAL domain-containing protein (putative c-di-GMP-specific phosphodiesterase class I)